ncbi:MAG: BspA family leucine-rich repeat surface protein [Lachnospiraceae bacterium]|nr:BspA family leucine-rich repeat surface protein [Lachnospiraceae bacterium]
MFINRLKRSVAFILSVIMITVSMPTMTFAELGQENAPDENVFIEDISSNWFEDNKPVEDVFEYEIGRPDNVEDFSGCESGTSFCVLEGEVYNGNAIIASGTNESETVSWTIDDAGHLLIEGEGDISGQTVFATHSEDIKTASVNLKNVVNLSNFFYKCKSLISVEINVTNTSLLTDTHGMFCGCSALTSLNVSGFDTSHVMDMSDMFYGCSSLTNLDVSGFDTSQVTDMSDMFYGCSLLTSLDVSGFDTSSVTDMSAMFSHCSALTSLDVSGFDTSHVMDMMSMFYGCSSLTSLDVSGFDTLHVTDMYEMFSGCSSLTNLDVSGFDTLHVTDMKCMFSGCSSLSSLDVSGFNTSQVTDMMSMFFECSSLTSLDVSRFDTSQVTDMTCMFFICSSLTSLDVSGFDTSSVKGMSNMFDCCSELTSLDVSGFDTSLVTDMKGMFFGCSSLMSLDVSGFDTSSVTNMNGMFSCCSLLTSLNVSGFDTSSVTNMSIMFSDCSALTSLNVSGFDTSLVKSMECMFEGCSSLTSLDVSGFDTSLVTDMKCMFSGCSLLTSLDVSGFDTSLVTDMKGMFHGCSSLTSLDVSRFDTSLVKSMECMFQLCAKLTDLDVSGFDTSSVMYMDYMFSYCFAIEKLDLSGFDTSHVTDMYCMFCYCYALAELDVSNFDTQLVVYMSHMFEECLVLKYLDLSGFDMSSVTEADKMFDDTYLEKIKTPVNCNCSVYLPIESGIWTDQNGKRYDALPSGDDSKVSVLLSSTEHTIKYINCDGATNPNPTFYSEGKGLVLQAPTRKGYEFVRWYYFEGEDNNIEVTITEIPEDAEIDYVIYAEWKRSVYTIKFDGNAASITDFYGGTQTPTICGKMDAQKITAYKGTALTGNAFKIAGYDFVGWNTKPDGSGEPYANKQKVDEFGNELDVTLYAQWKKTVYKIDYIGLDDGESSSFGLKTEFSIDSPEIVLKDYTSAVHREGYSFGGFYSDSKYKKAFKNIPEGSKGDKKIYVKMTANKYKVSFDKNADSLTLVDGTMPKCTGSMKTQSITYGNSTKLTKNGYSIKGFKFLGWTLNPEGEGKLYTDKGEVLNLTPVNGETIALYAQWGKADYTITYAGFTPEEVSDFGLPATYQIDSAVITLSDYTDHISRTGYVFKGFYKAKDYKTAFKSIATKSTGNKTVYVKMTANKYKVKFNKNADNLTLADGTKPKCTGSMKTQNITYDKSTKLSKNAFKIKGYNFLGWTLDPDGNGKVYTDKEAILNLTPVNGDTINLYAKWEKATYDIVYVGITQEEVADFGLPTTYQVDSPTITFADYTEKISIEGKTFKGWFSDKKYKNKFSKIGSGSIGKKTIYLKFKKAD